MRIWVDPDKLAARNLTAGDVVSAIREQNAQVAAGQIGQQPVPPGQETPDHADHAGPAERAGAVREHHPPRDSATAGSCGIKDVARVELGARNQDIRCKLDGKPSVGLIIFQLPDANALEVADRVHAKMDELAKDFPEGLIYEIQYDTTPYTRECIDEVFKALRDAVLLVAFVVLLFLQNWRSAVIPLVAVPVAIIGTFARDGGDRASASTISRSSAWCWPSASWSTTRSWSSRRWSTTSSKGWRRARPRSRR